MECGLRNYQLKLDSKVRVGILFVKGISLYLSLYLSPTTPSLSSDFPPSLFHSLLRKYLKLNVKGSKFRGSHSVKLLKKMYYKNKRTK